MKKQKVWIHCRVLSEASRNLLNYQEDMLKSLAESNNQEIVGVTKEVSNGRSFNSFGMNTLITEIKRNKIDAIFVTSKKRIAIFDDVLEEFELLCSMHNVVIISIKDIEDNLSKLFL
ncbi:MAG: recombinase family protein [Erysipelotrichaceae bacterium]